MDGRPTILIVGEGGEVRSSAKKLGFRTVIAGQPQAALRKVKGTAPSAVLINLPGQVPEPKFLAALSEGPYPIVILADSEVSASVRPINGKIRVVTRPVRHSDLDATIRTVLEDVQARPSEYPPTKYPPLLDLTPAMRALREIIERVADTNATVLVRGESGVGKELVARSIHAASPRHDQPLIKVNCAALPGELLESELFGHEKGAFTGAYRRKLGKFEFANKGTIFLDEIGELPFALQAKLLHILQDHEFSRVGGREMIRVDTRVIASTNRNLETALETGQFREDLYYRLNVVEIRVPPLRERRDEIPVLVTYFVEKFQRQYGRRVKLPPDILGCFIEYPWPGNVRELENVVKRFVVLGNVEQMKDQLVGQFQTHGQKHSKTPAGAEAPAPSPSVEPPMGLREIAHRAAREAERKAIKEILDRVHWNRTQAARLLKISYKTLLAKIGDCGLAPKQRRGAGG